MFYSEPLKNVGENINKVMRKPNRLQPQIEKKTRQKEEDKEKRFSLSLYG